MSHFLKNGSMNHIWLITYTIYTSYDCKFHFWFSDAKIFEIRLRKIFKSFFSPKCVGGIKISTSNSDSALNSASDSMWWYGVYIDIIDDSHEDPNCVGVKRYIPRKPIQTIYKSRIITYCPTQNLTLNSNLKSKFLFRPRILEKKTFENFA